MDDFPPPPSDEHAQPGEFRPAPGRRRRWIWVAFPLALFALVAAVLVLVLSGSEEAPVAAAPSAPPLRASSRSRHPRSPGRRRDPSGRPALDGRRTHRRRRRLRDPSGRRGSGTWIRARHASWTTMRCRAGAPPTRSGPRASTVATPGGLDRVSTPLRLSRRARVAGVFDVRGDVTSVYGITGYGDPTFSWRMTRTATRGRAEPGSGPGERHHAGARAEGGTYTASFTERLGITCSGTPVSRLLAPSSFT